MAKNKGCSKYVINLDLSQNYFNFTLPNGKKKYKTCSGGITTLTLGTVFLIFAITQLIEVYKRINYSVISESNYLDWHPETSLKVSSDEFPLAASITNLKGEKIGKEIGELQFVVKSWSVATEPPKFRILASRPCTTDDFSQGEGIEEEEEESSSDVRFHEMDSAT